MQEQNDPLVFAVQETRPAANQIPQDKVALLPRRNGLELQPAMGVQPGSMMLVPSEKWIESYMCVLLARNRTWVPFEEHLQQNLPALEGQVVTGLQVDDCTYISICNSSTRYWLLTGLC